MVDLPKDAAIDFPVDWHYKVVAENVPDVERRIADVLREYGYDVAPKPGNASKGGKYLSWHINVTLRDLETFRALSSALAAIDHVKFVL